MSKRMITPIESHWNSQRETLRDVRENLGPSHSQYKPLSDEHPLLNTSHRVQRRNSSPKPIPRLPVTPPTDRSGYHGYSRSSPSLRGAKYDVVPPVKPHVAFTSPAGNHGNNDDDDDSWGEDSDGEELYPKYPYPMVMYPLIVGPHPSTSPRQRRKHKGRPTKKKVHYRNTPTYLNSRENTKHTPLRNHGVPHEYANGDSKHDLFDPRSNSVLARYQYAYPSPRSSKHMDTSPPLISSLNPMSQVVNSLVNDVCDDEIEEMFWEIISEIQQPMAPDHPYYAPSFYYCEELLDREIPRMVREVVKESTRNSLDRPPPVKLDPQVYTDSFLSDLIRDVVATEMEAVVKETTNDLVADHMEEAGIYDNVMDMASDIVRDIGPELVEESLFEILLEDIINEDLLPPVLNEEAEEVAVETLTHYSDKVRSRDLRELKKTSTRLEDSFCLDYLLAYIARQGELWTEGEHANKLLDDIMLSTVLTEFLSVAEKKRTTTDCKPLRKYYEKIVSDVVSDVLLDELSRNLDEDMADLDEYERGVEQPDMEYKMPKDLKKWFDGR